MQVDTRHCLQRSMHICYFQSSKDFNLSPSTWHPLGACIETDQCPCHCHCIPGGFDIRGNKRSQLLRNSSRIAHLCSCSSKIIGGLLFISMSVPIEFTRMLFKVKIVLFLLHCCCCWWFYFHLHLLHILIMNLIWCSWNCCLAMHVTIRLLHPPTNTTEVLCDRYEHESNLNNAASCCCCSCLRLGQGDEACKMRSIRHESDLINAWAFVSSDVLSFVSSARPRRWGVRELLRCCCDLLLLGRNRKKPPYWQRRRSIQIRCQSSTLNNAWAFVKHSWRNKEACVKMGWSIWDGIGGGGCKVEG